MKKIRAKRLWGGLAGLSFFILFETIYRLLLSDFPSRQFFATTYFIYAASALTLVHSVFFFVNSDFHEKKGRRLSKNVPRYIDYVVTGLIAIGLVQIFFSEDMFAKYIEQISGSKSTITMNIRRTAILHLRDDCGKKSRFTSEYCNKLHEIVRAQDIEQYISKKLSSDFEFLDHPIDVVMVPPHGSAVIRSPIAKYVNQYVALQEYGVSSSAPEKKSAWNWLTLVLLPLVLAFRVTKTSLELYGELS